MGWNGEDVLNKINAYINSINTQEGLELTATDLNIFKNSLQEIIMGIAKKLNESTVDEVNFRSYIKGLILLCYVRRNSIETKNWAQAVSDIFRNTICWFPIIDPRCN